MDPGVIQEHKLMAERYKYSDKYRLIGKFKDSTGLTCVVVYKRGGN